MKELKSKELMDDFFASPIYGQRDYRLFTRILLHHLADRVHELRLADGQRLNDNLDFAAILRELAEGARISDRSEAVRKSRLPDFCPDCGHAHRGDSECEEPTGAGRTCRCERKVTA
jgi:hypothetical protein